MKMMIWKELRENWKWAALAFLGLLIAELYALSFSRGGSIGPLDEISLGSATFLFVTGLGCPAVGATLGALQILPELRRDQWASLLHRPISRHSLFLGKVVAGLVLCLLATVLPLLVSIGYAAWPGNLPVPFVPALALAPASDLLLGAVGYFAALLLALHRGKWFGARGAIVLGTLLILFCHLAVQWSLGWSLLAAAIFFVAAWGTMSGGLAARPWPARLALGLVMLAGLYLALLLTGGALIALAEKRLGSDWPASYQITADGTVLLRKSDGQGGSILTDLQGNPVTDERYLGNEAQQNFLYPNYIADRELDRDAQLSRSQPRSSLTRVQLVLSQYDSPELWYRIIGPHSYFVGYDRLSKRRIGICDAEGFKPPQAIPRPFPHQLRGQMIMDPPYLFWDEHQLFSFDFNDRRMTSLFRSDDETIFGALNFPIFRAERRRLAVVTGSKVHFFYADHQPWFTLPYGHDPSQWSEVSITSTADFSRLFLQYSPSWMSSATTPTIETHLDQIDTQDRSVRTLSKPQDRLAPLPPTWGSRLARQLNLPLVSLVATAWKRSHSAPQYFESNRLKFAGDLNNGELTTLFALGFTLAAIAWAWGRRDGLSSRQIALWAFLSLFFGLAGLLVGRLSLDWPACIRCPQCGHRRPIRTAACPHCQAAWAPPSASGAEIFEPA